VISDCFYVTVQGGGGRWTRSISSQMLPGRYETMRLILDRSTDSASVNMTLKGKGKALIRKISLHAIQPYTKPYDQN
jgi:hypothetical protein